MPDVCMADQKFDAGDDLMFIVVDGAGEVEHFIPRCLPSAPQAPGLARYLGFGLLMTASPTWALLTM